MQGNTTETNADALKSVAFSLLDAAEVLAQLNVRADSGRPDFYDKFITPLANIQQHLSHLFDTARGVTTTPSTHLQGHPWTRGIVNAHIARRKDDAAAAAYAAAPPRPAKDTSRKPRAAQASAAPTQPTGARSGKPAPPLSYAAAAKAAKSRLPAVVIQLAQAFPNEPGPVLVTMAEKLLPKQATNKPQVRHAPRHSSRHVDVTFVYGEAPQPEKVPLEAPLFKDVTDFLRNAGVVDTPYLESVVWNHRGRFRLTFAGVVPTVLDDTLKSYFRQFAPSRMAEAVQIERFRFRNQVVFRRVPVVKGFSSTQMSEACANALRSDPVWKDIEIAHPPNFFLPKNATHGMFFVEFFDNAMSSALKHVTSHPIHLNTALCHAVKTYNNKPSAPQCGVCLRWGHRTHLCRATSPRCWVCAGDHDERVHKATCDTCSIPGSKCVPTCLNCRGAHRADSKECSFYLRRRDVDWLRSHAPSGRPDEVKKKQGAEKQAKEKERAKVRKVVLKVAQEARRAVVEEEAPPLVEEGGEEGWMTE